MQLQWRATAREATEASEGARHANGGDGGGTTTPIGGRFSCARPCVCVCVLLLRFWWWSCRACREDVVHRSERGERSSVLSLAAAASHALTSSRLNPERQSGPHAPARAPSTRGAQRRGESSDTHTHTEAHTEGISQRPKTHDRHSVGAWSRSLSLSAHPLGPARCRRVWRAVSFCQSEPAWAPTTARAAPSIMTSPTELHQ